MGGGENQRSPPRRCRVWAGRDKPGDLPGQDGSLAVHELYMSLHLRLPAYHTLVELVWVGIPSLDGLQYRREGTQQSMPPVPRALCNILELILVSLLWLLFL